MVTNRRETLTRVMRGVPSRRNVLRGLAGAGLAFGATPLLDGVEAKRRKRKPKKANPNAFGCLDVGDRCKNAGQCCSGICTGKKGKQQCRAHDTGGCRQDGLGLCRVENPETAVCQSGCLCFRTTAGSNVCAEGLGPKLSQCADCTNDADCVALGFPPGTACAPFSGANCNESCLSATACVIPCGAELPDSILKTGRMLGHRNTLHARPNDGDV